MLLIVSACVVASGAGCGLTLTSKFGETEVGIVVRVSELGSTISPEVTLPQASLKMRPCRIQKFNLHLFIFSLTLVLTKEVDEGAHLMGTADKDRK